MLDLYDKPYDAEEPVICLDEKSKQLLADKRQPVEMEPGNPAKEDYEYTREDTRNLFVAVEPKGGRREVSVTAPRGALGIGVHGMSPGTSTALWGTLWYEGLNRVFEGSTHPRRKV